MSKRYLMMAAFLAGTVFGIAGLTSIGTTGSSSANAVPAPEVKPGADWIEVREYGPERSTFVNGGKGNQIAVAWRAYREQTGQQPVFYGVQFQGEIISFEDAEKLASFYAKYKDKNKSKAKEIEQTTITFSAKNKEGAKFQIGYSLNTQQFRRNGNECDQRFFEALDAAINDAKAMKKIPFSVTPE